HHQPSAGHLLYPAIGAGVERAELLECQVGTARTPRTSAIMRASKCGAHDACRTTLGVRRLQVALANHWEEHRPIGEAGHTVVGNTAPARLGGNGPAPRPG